MTSYIYIYIYNVFIIHNIIITKSMGEFLFQSVSMKVQLTTITLEILLIIRHRKVSYWMHLENRTVVR